MQKCKNCGSDFEGNFCPVCGSKAQEIVCPKCYKTIRAGVKFCSNCGQEFGPAPQQAETEEPQQAVPASIYDEIAKNGFEEAWKENNPKVKLYFTLTSWLFWLFWLPSAITLIVFFVKIFTLPEDLTELTPEIYNSVCLWANLTAGFYLFSSFTTSIPDFLKNHLLSQWVASSKIDVSYYLNKDSRIKLPWDKEELYCGLYFYTNKKINIIRLVLVSCYLLSGLAADIYLLFNINDFIKGIIGVKLANQLDIPYDNSSWLTIVIIFTTLLCITGVIKLILFMLNRSAKSWARGYCYEK